LPHPSNTPDTAAPGRRDTVKKSQQVSDWGGIAGWALAVVVALAAVLAALHQATERHLQEEARTSALAYAGLLQLAVPGLPELMFEGRPSRATGAALDAPAPLWARKPLKNF
jgi:hypothetical protein